MIPRKVVFFFPAFSSQEATAPLGILAVSLCMSLGVGCASTYYSAWQKLGYEKRDILVSRVKGARDDQQDAPILQQVTPPSPLRPICYRRASGTI